MKDINKRLHTHNDAAVKIMRRWCTDDVDDGSDGVVLWLTVVDEGISISNVNFTPRRVDPRLFLSP